MQSKNLISNEQTKAKRRKQERAAGEGTRNTAWAAGSTRRRIFPLTPFYTKKAEEINDLFLLPKLSPEPEVRLSRTGSDLAKPLEKIQATVENNGTKEERLRKRARERK